jgi:hypothetical protein
MLKIDLKILIQFFHQLLVIKILILMLEKKEDKVVDNIICDEDIVIMDNNTLIEDNNDIIDYTIYINSPLWSFLTNK